jgi:ubiquinone/menaquinone biosynthesis C-methylase UbiE
MREQSQEGRLQSSEQAIAHWDKTPLNVPVDQRYATYPWLREAAEFEKHAGERVLEIGCGAGADLEQFVLAGAIASAVDITPAHLELARERLKGRAQIRQAEATALPFPDNSFDYVYSHGVLHHVEQARKVVEEIFRVLRPGGRFNVMVYAKYSVETLALLVKHGHKWKLHVENSLDPVHIDLYSRRSLRRLFHPAALTFKKYECARAPFLARQLGWFLVAKGEKPR